MKIAAIAGAALALLAAPSAFAQSRSVVGVLECNVSGGFGFVFGSTRSMGCTYNPGRGQPPVYYTGNINRYGLDVGFTSSAVLIWNVLARTTDFGPDALAGTYVGVGADASIGAGLGANALVGGSNKTMALQPVQVEAKKGINIAAGIAEISLTPAR